MAQPWELVVIILKRKCQRPVYVGDTLTQEDIKAKYDNGILSISIPKKDAQAVETKKTIAIEG